MSDARAGVELDVGVLESWIGDRLPGAGEPLTAERLGEGSGIANALYFLRRGDHAWVLRRPPAIKNHPSAADTKREWRLLQALEGTPVPHPTPQLFCDDPDVIGATFMIMDLVDGFTPGSGVPDWVIETPHGLHDLAMAYVDGLVELSKVDWRAGGLEGLGKPDGFLERQVSRWVGQLDGYRVRGELPEEAFLSGWLEATPEDREAVALLGRFLADSRALLRRVHGERAAETGPIMNLLAERMGVDSTVDPRPETIAVAMGAAASAAFNRWAAAGGQGSPAEQISAALDLLESGLGQLDEPLPRKRARSTA